MKCAKMNEEVERKLLLGEAQVEDAWRHRCERSESILAELESERQMLLG